MPGALTLFFDYILTSNREVHIIVESVSSCLVYPRALVQALLLLLHIGDALDTHHHIFKPVVFLNHENCKVDGVFRIIEVLNIRSPPNCEVKLIHLPLLYYLLACRVLKLPLLGG